MTNKPTQRDSDLRKRAEEAVASDLSITGADLADLETKRLLHELQVHQVELEMQNEELRLVAAAKSEHEEHLRNIIKMTPAGYFRLDTNDCFADVNEAWLRMHGYDSPDEVIGRHFSMLQVESESDSSLKHLAELHKGMPIPSGTFKSRRKDGSVGHHIFSAHPVVHVGNIVGFEWFIIDMSELEQIDEVKSYLLQINSIIPGEDFFESLAGFLAKTLNMDFICIDRLEGDGLSARTVAVWCDGHFEDNVTYALKDTPCGEVVGKNVCCYPASVCQFFPRDQVLQDLRAESYVGVTLWSHTHQPIGLIAVISRRPLMNRHLAEQVMNLVGVRAAAEMERMDADELLRESEEKYRNLFNNSGLGMFRTRLDGSEILEFNKKYLEMTGYTHEEVLGKPSKNLWANKSERERMVQDLETEGYIENFECDILNKQGEVLRCVTSLRLYRDEGILEGSIMDITSLKKAEEDRTNLQQQLHQSQKMESLGVLAGGIAHDFNNILAVIMCYSSLGRQKPEKAAEFMPEIEKASERAAALCRQMLAYAGKTQFVQSQVDVTALVDDILGMLKSTLPQNVNIKPYLTGDLPTIEGDASQLRQIVMNLMINASEAIGEEEGDIRVALTETRILEEQAEKDHLGKAITPGQYLCLEVTDTGCGMDEETKKRIFEPFYTTKFVGRGLGMSAVLGIMTAHRGALQLQSQPGHGTTFRVYLPVHAGMVAVEESLPRLSLLPWLGSGTILLVEDESQIRAVATELLEELRFKVVAASNGIEALKEYGKNSSEIRLVLTDIDMPQMNGYKLIAELKKINPAVPIIVSSGFGDEDVTSRIPPGDIAGLISKPFRFEQLRSVLKSVLEGA